MAAPPATQTYTQTVATRGQGFIEVVPKPGFFQPGSKLPALNPNSQTMLDLYLNSYSQHATKRALGHKPMLSKDVWGPFSWMSYAEVAATVGKLAGALVSTGLAPLDRVAIFCANCPEWVLAEQAIAHQNMVSVPLYATFGIPAMTFILRQSQVKASTCSAETLPILLEAAEKLFAADSESLHLRTVIAHSALVGWKLPEEMLARASAIRVRLILWEDALKMGASVPPVPSTPDSIFSIVYTSGTTGEPKGAILTHRNAVGACDGGRNTPQFNGWADVVHMSYMPLAHVFERQLALAGFSTGSAIGFPTGSLPNLFNDIAELQPTFLIGVPRVWKRLYDRVTQTISQGSFISRTLFNYALASKTAVEEQGAWGFMPWDSIVFSELSQKLGGRCKFIISGGAALSEDLYSWLSRCFLLDVYQGYGLTESLGGIVVQCPGYDKRFKTSIGLPMHGSKLRLIDIPEMDYFTSKNCGEICLQGPPIFVGYFQDPEKTAEAFAGTDWLHTGDVGRLNEDGSISVIDRKKNERI
jgi:long-chain acyl-CoA synthetase